jgi:hypothetical protein
MNTPNDTSTLSREEITGAPIMSNKIDKIAAALAKVHLEIKPISKTSDVKMSVKNKGGGYSEISYKTATYTDMWDMTNEILAKNGLSFLCLGSTNKEKGTVIGLLVHESGQFFKSELKMNLPSGKRGDYSFDESTEPKKVGSWITYLCKYMYKAMMNLPTDDDDAIATDKAPNKPKGKDKPKEKKAPVQKEGCISPDKVKTLATLFITKKEKNQISNPDVDKILEVEAGGVKLFKNIPEASYMKVYKAITEFGI